jgi:hypothetical protein
MMRKNLLFCLLLLSVAFKVAAQEKEFWFVAPDVSEAHGNCDAPTFLVISNPTDNPVNVNVTINGNPGITTPYTIGVGQSQKIDWDLTNTRTIIENPRGSAGTITNKGIHIEVTSGDGVLAYYQVDGSCSKDLFSLKGSYALGNEFYIPMMHDNYYKTSSYADGYDQIDIVAAKTTDVTFTIDKPCVGYSAGTHTISLTAGQTFKLMEDQADARNTTTLAGTKITASIPNSIAVTVTEDCAVSGGSIDVMGDQIVPVSCTGTRYVVVKGQTTGVAMDRLYFTASTGPASVTVTGDGGFSQTIALSGAGVTDVVIIGNSSTTPNVVYVEASSPVYCYHVSAAGTELGSALIPSMFSITQQQLAFFAANTAISDILVVFRDTCETYFEISNDGVTYVPLTVTANPIPGLTGSVTWCWDKLALPAGYRNNNLVTIRNSESAFSLGYFNGNTTGTSGYGYISGFGDWELPYDTLWRCQGSNARFTLMGGYALGYDWELPDGTHKYDIAISLQDTGRYTIDMDVDYKHIYDTVYLYEATLDPTIERLPKKPAKVGVPQLFTAVTNSNMPNAKYYWTFEGANPATSTLANPLVTWNSTGEKRVTLTIEIEAGSGDTKVVCDKTVTLDLLVRPKNNGYFVDQNVSGGLHDGSNWQNAFLTVQEALELASQGDYVWVAKGEYSPVTDGTYLIDYDSVSVYGGFGAWEANLNERDFVANPTILNGRNNSVVTFDGATAYTNGFCGISTGAILDGFIIQNGKATDGAGILFTNGASGTVSNCIIRSNHATQNGGGIYMETTGCGHDSPVFFNLEISSNTAAEGAGIYNSSNFMAANITVSGNSATSIGGLYNSAGNPAIRNSIIWGNRDKSGAAMDVTASAGTPAYTYSIIGGSSGSGSTWNVALGTDAGKNTDVNPLFRMSGFDEAGTMRQGNYKLTATSKAVNTGRNNFVSSDNHLLKSISLLTPVDTVYINHIPNDLDGGNRIEYDIVDRGAYEYYKDNSWQEIVHQIFIPVVDNVTTDPENGLYWIGGHDSYVLILYPKEGYSLQDIEITTGSKRQDEDGGMLVVYNEDGSVTVTFREVTEPINVQISGISPVSNDIIDSSYAIWTANNRLHVKTTKAGTLKVYTLTGAMLKQQELTEGEISFPLSQGVYIVTFNDGSQQKVVVK